MAADTRNAGRPFYGWWIVGACVICLSTNPGAFVYGSLGLFVIPFGAEFGWDRAQISVAAALFTATSALSIPVLGQLVDRFDTRRVLIPSLLILGAGLASITVSVSKLWHLWLLFALLGCLTAGANSLPYVRTLSLWFDRRRGLALGIAMTGNGLGFAYVPPLVQFAVDHHGWRAGYLVLAAIAVLIALPIVYLVMRESPASMGLQPDGASEASGRATASPAIGVTRADAIRTRVFWTLAFIFAVFAFSAFGLMPHLVPMLIDRGMSGTDAAFAAASIGISVITSRLVIGYLLDHVFGPYLALACMVAAGVGLGVLSAGVIGLPAFVAAAMVGLGVGAELELLTYLVGRYFGLRYFGQIYGLLFALFLVGGAFGPYCYGMVFESTGSYVPILGVCAILAATAGLMNAMLPRYPDLTDLETASAKSVR